MGWLSDLWDAVTGVFSSSPPQEPTQPCTNGNCTDAISPERAQEVFDQLAANSSIPFDYPPDCCYARATEMVSMMDNMGVQSRKVWTYGTLVPMTPQNAPVRFPPGNGQQVIWRYHVAPTVNVTQPDGSVQPMVMDPSLASGPVTVNEWNQIMSGPGSNLSQTAFTDTDVWYRNQRGRIITEPSNGRQDAFAGHIATRDAALGR
ncbi:MAG: protein-glutamine glutaminase family protein [Pseudomonadota bacterium]